MAMGDPDVFAFLDGIHLLGGNLVGEPPAAEVGGTGDPRVGREQRPAVVQDHRRVSDRLESDTEGHWQSLLRRHWMCTIPATEGAPFEPVCGPCVHVPVV